MIPLPAAMSSITAVIVDDEVLAREAIRLRLQNEPDIDVVGEAADGADAVELLRRLKPDLVFLDVQMPVMDGFEVLDNVSSDHLPIVVFVTAYDRYALKAFETHALDYLLKPFTAGRFHAAIERARLEVARAGDHETHQRVIEVLDERRRARAARPARARRERRLPGSSRRQAQSADRPGEGLPTSTGSSRPETTPTSHAQGASHVVRMTMGELERRLDPAQFARIHRSTIVQIDRIEGIIAAWHGDFDVTLRDGTVLRLSRNYRDRVLTSKRHR